MICEQCGKDHEGNYGSGRFCCRSCSNRWVALHQSPEAKARKIEKGRGNLTNRGWEHLTDEQLAAARSKGGNTTAKLRRLKRKEWLDNILFTEGAASDVYNGGYAKFRDYLIEYGYKEHKCEICGGVEWLGNPIPIELHHKDSNGNHNYLSNLQILCPNCHAMTDSHGWNYYNNYRKDKES